MTDDTVREKTPANVCVTSPRLNRLTVISSPGVRLKLKEFGVIDVAEFVQVFVYLY